MKSILLTLFIVPLAIFSSITSSPKASNNIVVLELFTSKGCSSCPPADRLLNEVKSDNIIALSYHVDYWNYIGWKDPFSKAAYSNKQRAYGSKFRSGTIYTPQLVINGQEHIVGSDRRLLDQKIKSYKAKSNANQISLSKVSKSDVSITFNYEIEGSIKDRNIRTILVINERETVVKRGENRNKVLVNTNIVVSELQFQLSAKSGEGAIIIPESVKPDDDLSIIVVIENEDMDILGASQYAL